MTNASNDTRYFRVLEVDDDTAHLLDLGVTYEATARGFGVTRSLSESMAAAFTGAPAVQATCWVRPDQSLAEGAHVAGCFEFDPKHSLTRGRLPRFYVREAD